MAQRPPDFASYYEAVHPRVLRAVALVLGDPEHAARIAHESFVRTHAAWSRVGAQEPLTHTLRCAFRLAWRVRTEPTDAGAEASVAAVLPGGPGRGAPADPRDVDLALALASLPRSPRVVLVFSSYLGLDDPTIGEVMGMRAHEVAAHRAQAHASLRALLGEERSGVA